MLPFILIFYDVMLFRPMIVNLPIISCQNTQAIAMFDDIDLNKI